jgi:hypothetical protein
MAAARLITVEQIRCRAQFREPEAGDIVINLPRDLAGSNRAFPDDQ